MTKSRFGYLYLLLFLNPLVAPVCAQNIPLQLSPEMRYYRSLTKKVPLPQVLKQLEGQASAAASDKRASFYLFKAFLEDEQDMRPEALVDANRAISCQPGFEDAQLLRARILFQTGAYEKSIKAASECVKAHPESFHSHYLRAKLLLDRESFEAAIDDFSFCIKLNPTGSSARQYRAEAYEHLGKTNLALADITVALVDASDTQKMRCLAQRAKLYEKMGKKDLAEKDKATLNSQSSDMFNDLMK